MKNHRFVFIGGLHRSGTTLLEKVIESHNDIAGHVKGVAPYMEGQLFQSVYPTDQQMGGVGRFAFNRDSHLTEKSSLITNKNRETLFEEWSKYWDLEKPILLEKSPPNGIKSRFLQGLFPDSYFIFVTRHPFAVSLATQKWSKTSLLSLIEHWITYNEIMTEDAEHINNKIIIKYEDFVATPNKILNEVSELLEIQNDFKLLRTISPSINEKYFSQIESLKKSANLTNRRIFKAVKYLRKNKFPLFVKYDKEIDDIALRFEERIQKFGYSFYNCD
jgi:hypothetical protein